MTRDDPQLFDTTPHPQGPMTVARPEPVFPPSNRTRASKDGARAAAWNFSAQCHQVHEAIKAAGERGATNFELVNATGLSMNRVCGRTNELADMGQIVMLPNRRESDGCDSGVKHQVWKASGRSRA